MKRFFAVMTIFTLAFTACEQPTDEKKSEQKPKGPSLAVEYGSRNVVKNETLNFGETIINDTKQVDFVLKNTGVGKLLLTGETEPVKISNAEAGVFSVVQPTGSEAAPDVSLPFKINFAPKAAQTYTATVTIGSNDQNGDFIFSITAIGAIKWDNEPNGTLTVINNTAKDMVLFTGQTPTVNNIIGGVKAGSSKDFDISDDVYDFQVGGFMVLRGITLNEYNANKANLSLARIEYSVMAAYGQNKKFRAEIMPSYMGDYAYRFTNIGRIGMELRKDSPDGEKIGYLPNLASNMLLYADSTDGFAIYPVYVYYTKSNGQVTSLKPTSMFETVSVSPRAATGGAIQSYTFPADTGVTWENIKGTLTSPVAYVTVTNNVQNQSGRVTIAGTSRIKSQNGFDSIGSGEMLTYEIESTVAGSPKNIVLSFYNGVLNLPVRFTDSESEQKIKNGYDYTVSVSGSGQNASGYTVTLIESANPRDLSNDIASL
jgi:hypothetical protein